MDTEAIGHTQALPTGGDAPDDRLARRAGLPRSIGCYRILDLIGEGGMGLVYRAAQEAPIRRQVALKVIKPGVDSREVLGRFEAERQLLALMDHPNVARALDAGQTDRGDPYFVMELIAGEPITGYCNRRGLSTAERLKLFIPVCRAIQHAHHKGVIHRDLKPQNVLVTMVDGVPVAKVIDFGIAKATGLSFTNDTLFTNHGQVLGTPEYMSPEQADGGATDIDTRTDVYSLGALLYELLTGTTPFDFASRERVAYGDVQRALREDEPQRPSLRVATMNSRDGTRAARLDTDVRVLARQLRHDLDWIVLKALSKDRGRRYETADALAEDIERYLRNEPLMAGPPSTSYRIRKLVRRNRLAVGAASAIALGIVVASSALVYAIVESRRQNLRIESAFAESEAVKSFLTDMLTAADPRSKGRQVTVKEVLEQSEQSIDARFADHPRELAAIRSTFGRSFAALGLYERAQPHLEQSLALHRQIDGVESDDSLASLLDLAHVYRQAGRHDLAREHYRELIDILGRVRGQDHPDTLAARNWLISLEEAKRLEDSEVEAREVLERVKRQFGDSHRLTVSAMINLANILCQQSWRSECGSIAEQALAISRDLLGERAEETIRAHRLLGVLDGVRGDYGPAESHFRTAAESARAIWDESHPQRLHLVADLGWIYKKQGRYEEAERLYLDALDLARRELGPEHDVTIELLNNLGQLYRRQGRREEAIRVLRYVLDASTRRFGESHFLTLNAMRNLGMAYRENGLDDEAERLLVKTAQLSQALYGDRFHYTRGSLKMLASFYEDQGRFEDALGVRSQIAQTER